jgi:hypothetical protein
MALCRREIVGKILASGESSGPHGEYGVRDASADRIFEEKRAVSRSCTQIRSSRSQRLLSSGA